MSSMNEIPDGAVPKPHRPAPKPPEKKTIPELPPKKPPRALPQVIPKSPPVSPTSSDTTEKLNRPSSPPSSPKISVSRPPIPSKPLPPAKPLPPPPPSRSPPQNLSPVKPPASPTPPKHSPNPPLLKPPSTENLPSKESTTPPRESKKSPSSPPRTNSQKSISKDDSQAPVITHKKTKRRIASTSSLAEIFQQSYGNQEKPQSHQSIGKETFTEVVNREALQDLLAVDMKEEKSKSISRAFSSKIFKKKEAAEKQEKDLSKIKQERRKTLNTGSTKFFQKGSRLKLPFGGTNSKKVYENRLAEHLKEIHSDPNSIADLFSSLFTEVEKLDTWSSKTKESRNWSEVEAADETVEPEILDLLDRSPRSEGFTFEFGRKNIIYSSKKIDVENKEKNISYYRDNLFKKDVLHFIYEGEDESVGPVYICAEKPTEDSEEVKVILMDKKEDHRFLINSANSIHSKDLLRQIKQEFPKLANIKFTKIVDPEIGSKIVEFESQAIVDKYKFGLLYVKEGQTDENDMFSNGGGSPTSQEYEDFLDFIGERITLNGWSKYRGGLDVKTNTTGEKSIYCQHRGYEIMFHVSTLLPFQPDDLQRVERKRHLGNDIVVLVFKEGNTPFNPLCLTSHFNHVFVVVSPLKVKGQTFYKVAIANKPSVPPYGPFLHTPSVYPKGNKFKDFLLTKLINAERAAMDATDFKGKMIRTRKMLLEGYAKDFIAKAKAGIKPKTPETSPASPFGSFVSSTSSTSLQEDQKSGEENASTPPQQEQELQQTTEHENLAEPYDEHYDEEYQEAYEQGYEQYEEGYEEAYEEEYVEQFKICGKISCIFHVLQQSK